VVYGSGQVDARYMASVGLKLNLLIAPTIAMLCWLLL
jgi:hypothetical protein